ncbi:MAG TPA: hypothetical protein VG737_11635, partial [Cyclobacteriaceae bacterium]|nr:hypothetical protein [Cyclobacteriaceae bacterium]
MPKKLTLRSLTRNDGQDGDENDDVRLILVLDGFPQPTIKFGVGEHKTYKFKDTDNQVNGKPLVFWSNVDITAYEADSDGGIDALWDSDVDEWVQNVRLNHTPGDHIVKIGKKSESSRNATLMTGRTDTEWELAYSVEPFDLLPEQGLFGGKDFSTPYKSS